MSKLTLLVFVVSLIACTYAAIKVTNDPIPISDIPYPWYMIPVHPNKQGPSLNGDGTSTALEDKEKQGLFSWALSTAYNWTIGPIMNIFSSILSIIFAPFTYVGSFIGLSKVPPSGNQRSRRQAESEPETDTALQTELGSDLDPASTDLQPFDIDALTNLAIMSFQFVIDIYQYIMEWTDVVIDILNASNDIDFDQLFSMDNVDFYQIMDYVVELIQEIAIRISLRLWSLVKTDLLPLLDDAIVEFQDSGLFSDDVKQMLLSFHAAYQMAHLLDII